jgi:oligopeptide/dipeptide ABC transporter ATP-binding protein
MNGPVLKAPVLEVPVLKVSGLTVSVGRGARRHVAVQDVGFEVPAGGSLGVVGESGSGKSLTLRALMGLLPPGVRAERGVVELAGEPLPFTGPRARSARRGRLAMVFQDPLSGLDPVHTVGAQVAEVPRRVLGQPAVASRRRAVELLRLVGLPDPERRSQAFPHQLSGGMRQRVLIAMALASEPKVLLCDEPTTALDVTVQAQVLELLDDVRRRLGVAVVFVSHDLAVVRQVCDRLAVMYTGRLVETGRSADVLDHPAHPYTLGLLEAVVDLDDVDHMPVTIPGALPDLAHVPSGCPFHPRCRFASEDCAQGVPPFRYLNDRQWGAGEGSDGEGTDEEGSDGEGTDEEVTDGARGTACKYPERVTAG